MVEILLGKNVAIGTAIRDVTWRYQIWPLYQAYTLIYLAWCNQYNCFYVTSEVDALILKKNSTNICFQDKIENHERKGYPLTTNLYRGGVMPKGRQPYSRKRQQAIKRTNDNPTTRNTVKLLKNTHMNLAHPKEYRMCATNNHLHYSVNVMLEFFSTELWYKSIWNS